MNMRPKPARPLAWFPVTMYVCSNHWAPTNHHILSNNSTTRMSYLWPTWFLTWGHVQKLCGSKLLPPFGSYCKMSAVVEGYNREDDKYLSFLEDEYVRRKLQDERRVKEEGAGGVHDQDLLPTNLIKLHKGYKVLIYDWIIWKLTNLPRHLEPLIKRPRYWIPHRQICCRLLWPGH